MILILLEICDPKYRDFHKFKFVLCMSITKHGTFTILYSVLLSIFFIGVNFSFAYVSVN